LVWSTVIAVSGIELPTVTEKLLAYVPTLALVVAVAFDLLLWRLPWLRKAHKRPLLRGTWDTVITPHPDSHIPPGGNRGPIYAVTEVEQSFWTMCITMKSDESESISRAEQLASDGGSRTRQVLTYTYTNTPTLAVRERSPIHVGATMLSVVGDKPQNMTGTYWTDRLTIGDLNLTRRKE